MGGKSWVVSRAWVVALGVLRKPQLTAAMAPPQLSEGSPWLIVLKHVYQGLGNREIIKHLSAGPVQITRRQPAGPLLGTLHRARTYVATCSRGTPSGLGASVVAPHRPSQHTAQLTDAFARGHLVPRRAGHRLLLQRRYP